MQTENAPTPTIALSPENLVHVQRLIQHMRNSLESAGFTVTHSENFSEVVVQKPEYPNCVSMKNIQDILLPTRVFHHAFDKNGNLVSGFSTNTQEPFHWEVERFNLAISECLIHGMQVEQEEQELQKLNWGAMSFTDTGADRT